MIATPVSFNEAAGMKKQGSPPTAGRREPSPGGKRQGLPTVDECRRLDGALRHRLEGVEDAVRSACSRSAAEVDRPHLDKSLFLRASATVIVSIAASLMDVVSERTGEPFREGAFAEAARDAAEFIRNRSERITKGSKG